MLVVIMGLIDIAAGIMLYLAEVSFIPESIVSMITILLIAKGCISLAGQVFA